MRNTVLRPIIVHPTIGYAVCNGLVVSDYINTEVWAHNGCVFALHMFDEVLYGFEHYLPPMCHPHSGELHAYAYVQRAERASVMIHTV